MRFGVRCLRQEIGAVLNITCSMAVSSKSGNTKLVADALQRELTDAGVRFVASFDLDGAAAELARGPGGGAESRPSPPGYRAETKRVSAMLRMTPKMKREMNNKYQCLCRLACCLVAFT